MLKSRSGCFELPTRDTDSRTFWFVRSLGQPKRRSARDWLILAAGLPVCVAGALAARVWERFGPEKRYSAWEDR